MEIRQTNMMIRCKNPKCRSENSIITDFDNGEIVCKECGYVQENRLIDETYEKRNFGSEAGGEAISRVNAPEKITDINKSTVYVADKTNFTKLAVNCPLDIYSRGNEQIEMLLSKKGIELSLREETKNIYNEIVSKTKMKGRKFKYMVGAMYYYACKRQNISKTFKQISEELDLEVRGIKKALNYIKYLISQNSDPNHFLNNIKNHIRKEIRDCREIKYKEKQEMTKVSDIIANNLVESGILEGKSNYTLVGLIIKLTSLNCDIKINMDKIYNKYANETTIKNAFNIIKNDLSKILPDDNKEIIRKIISKF